MISLTRWLALFATFGYISSFGVYQDLYVLSGTASSSNISWIGSVQIWCLSAIALPAGSLLDKGYFKHVVFVGTIIYLFRFVLPLLDDYRLLTYRAVFSCFLWYISTTTIRSSCLKVWGWESVRV